MPRLAYPPADCQELREFFNRRHGPYEADGTLANRYAAFLCALFRAAKIIFTGVVCSPNDYGRLAYMWYEFIGSEATPVDPPPHQTQLYKAVVGEAEVKHIQQCSESPFAWSDILFRISFQDMGYCPT
jgi:hypothetical protein